MARPVDAPDLCIWERAPLAAETATVCRAADWRGDEPLTSNPGDCVPRPGACVGGF